MTGPNGQPAFATIACYCGDPAVGGKVLEPLRTFATPIADLIQQRPYVEMQSLFDPINPPGRRYYNKAHNISKVNDAAIDTVFDHMGRAPTPSSSIVLQQLHGAATRVPVSEERLLTEAAVLAEKSDIEEEIVRLRTHVDRFVAMLDEGGELGKRLDFLLQELNREANTMLSKTSGAAGENSLRITELGLEMKAEIEKCREQVQNLE